MALSVPAAVQMRQLAMAYALQRALPEDRGWQDAPAAAEGVVDVKEALKRTVTAPLEVLLQSVSLVRYTILSDALDEVRLMGDNKS